MFFYLTVIASIGFSFAQEQSLEQTYLEMVQSEDPLPSEELRFINITNPTTPEEPSRPFINITKPEEPETPTEPGLVMNMTNPFAKKPVRHERPTRPFPKKHPRFINITKPEAPEVPTDPSQPGVVMNMTNPFAKKPVRHERPTRPFPKKHPRFINITKPEEPETPEVPETPETPMVEEEQLDQAYIEMVESEDTIASNMTNPFAKKHVPHERPTRPFPKKHPRFINITKPEKPETPTEPGLVMNMTNPFAKKPVRHERPTRPFPKKHPRFINITKPETPEVPEVPETPETPMVEEDQLGQFMPLSEEEPIVEVPTVIEPITPGKRPHTPRVRRIRPVIKPAPETPKLHEFLD